jgi:hypothetical protein
MSTDENFIEASGRKVCLVAMVACSVLASKKQSGSSAL